LTTPLQCINTQEQSVKHIDFDISFKGDCDVVVAELAKRAGWDLKHPMVPAAREVDITAEDEDKGIWLVRDSVRVQATDSKQEPASVETSS